ncbi:diacylglycerol/lipid kinase family protein [Brevibacterium antiquum]|uniref:Diacylglycerol kinase family enzyme n=2 Tax=Brevibacterium TaxID=1696 RepID=A0A2H1KAK7_9MICO|nr:diacylglycerol kinase family protein [Brevibacterium antiquum]SMX96594.1 Diacylglycerol kinase family enzyme [Brevibacterium antiquum CNRZ 918]
MKVGILVNPKHAQTMRAYACLVEILKRERITYRSATTTRQWPGAEQSKQMLDWGADLIVVLGGDGTLRASAPILAAAEVPVAIIPTGTANVLSRHIGIRSAEHALGLVESHLGSIPLRSCEVPVNEAHCLTADGPRCEQFLSMAGIGGDARAIAGRAGLPGFLGYAWGAARALFAPLINVEIAGPQLEAPTRVWSVMASKTARPAGPIPVFDHAEVSAGELEFLAVALTTTKPRQRLVDWARVGWDCVNRRPATNPSLHYWRGTELSISLDGPAPVQLDGDLIGDCRRLDLRAGTSSLRVLAPGRRGLVLK